MDENVFGLTDKGKLRDNNEDAFVAEAFGNNYILGAVIDGVGGYSGGEIAAEITKESLLQLKADPGGDILVSLSKNIIAANERIYEERQRVKEHFKMACVVTAVVADLNQNQFYYAHIGDTRLYLYRDGSLVKVTRDHSSVGFLEETGRLTEQEAMRHPKRNEINKALGFDHHDLNENFIDAEQSPFLPGDLLLICSDGLTDMANHSQISSILEEDIPLSGKCEKLIAAANDAGGKDNITVVLIKNTNAGITHAQVNKQEKKRSDTYTSEETRPIAVEDKEVVTDQPDTKQQPNRSRVGFLILVFLIAVLYFLQLKKKPSQAVITAPIEKTQNKSLQDSIDSAPNNLLVLSGTSLILNHTLYIKKDSFHIRGNGTVIKSDSLFTGAALLIDSTCHFLSIDSLTFENFKTGIVVMKKGLHMNKVEFKSCTTPIKYQYLNTKDSVR